MALSLFTLQLGIASPHDADIYALTGADPVRVALVKAVIAAESGWNSGALRYEPALNDASYGLMQVLHRTAQIYAPTVTPGELFIPRVNLEIGIAHLDALLARYDLNDTIAAYNAGTPRRNDAGQYTNSKGSTVVQSYVNNVLQGYAFYLEHQQPVEWPATGSFVPAPPILDQLTSSGVLIPALTILGAIGLAVMKRHTSAITE